MLRRTFKPSDSLDMVCVYMCVCVCSLPDDVYVSVLGSQVEGRRPVGVGGVSFFGFQQSSTHVTGQ